MWPPRDGEPPPKKKELGPLGKTPQGGELRCVKRPDPGFQKKGGAPKTQNVTRGVPKREKSPQGPQRNEKSNAPKPKSSQKLGKV